MAEHVIEWLSAYLDGELHGLERGRVDAHLAKCEICRAELEALQSLSTLLRTTPLPAGFTPPERFTAQTLRRLPENQPIPSRRKALEAGWWLVPVGLFAAWVFLQVTLGLSALVGTASGNGLLGSTATWLSAAPGQNEWVGMTMNLFAGNLNETSRQLLIALGEADLFSKNLLAQFSWQFGVAALYWGWLVVWWLRRQPKQIEAEAATRLEMES
jgi:hypothetical protein